VTLVEASAGFGLLGQADADNGSAHYPPPLLERVITNGRIATCLTAQHQYAAIARRARQRPAPHVVAALAATGHTRPRPTPHPTPRRRATGAAGAAGAGPAAAEGRDGHEQVRPCHTRLPKCSHSRQSAKPLRREQLSNLTCVTSSCATRGTTGRGQPKSCTVCSWRLVSKFGSARRTLASAYR